MCGLPNDSIDKVEKTHDFIVNNEPTGYYWNNLKVFTGTSIFNSYMEKHIAIRDENVFNPIKCNELTYNNISPYHPRAITRSGDDVSWSVRKQQTKRDIFEYLTGREVSKNLLLRIDMPADLKSFTKILTAQISLDCRILLFSCNIDGYYLVNSVLLAELQAVALFESNTNDQIYQALCDISPLIRLPKNDFLMCNKKMVIVDAKGNANQKLFESAVQIDLNSREMKEQLMDIIVCLNK